MDFLSGEKNRLVTIDFLIALINQDQGQPVHFFSEMDRVGDKIRVDGGIVSAITWCCQTPLRWLGVLASSCSRTRQAPMSGPSVQASEVEDAGNQRDIGKREDCNISDAAEMEKFRRWQQQEAHKRRRRMALSAARPLEQSNSGCSWIAMLATFGAVIVASATLITFLPDGEAARYATWACVALTLAASVAHEKLVVTPLLAIYFRGPSLGKWACWGGIAQIDICSQLSGVSAEFWIKHSDECAELVKRHSQAFVIGVELIIVSLCMWKIVNLVLFRYFVLQPMMETVGALIKTRGRTLSDYLRNVDASEDE